jgi:Bifunctional PLP-dependent enzyme with beta-cystathionase and maltose regulon repressor activities
MDFDTVIDRRGTGSLKWDNAKNAPGLPDIIPLWVADMDFAPPEAVLEAIRGRAGHPVFGYTNESSDYFEAVRTWYRERQGIELRSDELLLAPSVIPSLAVAVNVFAKPGEGVMIMPPVYHPFFSVVKENGRALVEAPLARNSSGEWHMDLAGMEAAASRAEKSGSKLRAIIISSPHNPVGRVWSSSELEQLLDFALERDLALLCDEIHSDIILGDRPFLSMASISGERARKLVVFSGPNKTFNIAGLHISQLIARESETRLAMKRGLSAAGFSEPNIFSQVAATAAYREGGPWLDSLIGYLKENYRFVVEYCSRELPDIEISKLEGSYLAWLDARRLLSKRAEGPDERVLAARLEEKGRVRLSPGSIFGAEGSGFFRLNFACPRSVLKEGLERMAGEIRKKV